MTTPGGDVHDIARPKLALDELAAVVFEGDQDTPGLHEEALLLHAVVLKGQAAAGIQMEDLPDVLGGLSPHDLVAPGLVDTSHAAVRWGQGCWVTNVP